MRFSQEFIEKITDSNNLVEVISQYTQMKRTGSQLMGRCPFPDHAEKTPSFSVSESKQVYHCFGCGKSGNIFSFLRDYQGMGFPEAVEYLADRSGIAMPVPQSPVAQDAEEKQRERKRQISEANKLATRYFVDMFKKLPAQHPVREYVKKRGLSSETLETFQIGYAGSEWDGLVNHLSSKSIAKEISEAAQLIRAKQSGGGYFDLFRERLIFPIQNHLGDSIAFGGRIIFEGQPKYLNSPETPVFSKSRTLYGLHHTAKFIRSEDLAIVVEGYMDAVSLYQAGIQNVVAIMGTAMTSDHCRMLKRMTNHVLVLLDGDAAGQNAAERSLPVLLAQGLYPRGLVLPDGQDPDDFVKTEGVEVLKQKIQKSEDLFKIVLKDWMKSYIGEAQQKVQLADRARPVFEQMSDLRLKKLYVQELAQQMQVHPNWLVEALGGRTQLSKTPTIAGNSLASANPVPTKNDSGFEIELKSAPSVEQTLLALAIKSRANFQIFSESKVESFITSLGVKSVLEIASNLSRQGPEKFDRLLSLLVSKVDAPDILFFNDQIHSLGHVFGTNQNSTAETEITEEELTLDKETQILKDAIRRVRETGLRDQLKKLALEMKENPKADTVERMQRLQIEMRELKDK